LFRVIIDQDEGGVFGPAVPSLPGCVTQGATCREAVANTQEAIAAYLESLRERDEPLPPSIREELVGVAVRAASARQNQRIIVLADISGYSELMVLRGARNR